MKKLQIDQKVEIHDSTHIHIMAAFSLKYSRPLRKGWYVIALREFHSIRNNEFDWIKLKDGAGLRLMWINPQEGWASNSFTGLTPLFIGHKCIPKSEDDFTSKIDLDNLMLDRIYYTEYWPEKAIVPRFTEVPA